jgi:hypothetical protein
MVEANNVQIRSHRSDLISLRPGKTYKKKKYFFEGFFGIAGKEARVQRVEKGVETQC